MSNDKATPTYKTKRNKAWTGACDVKLGDQQIAFFQQENEAKKFVHAVNNIDRIEAENKELREALQELLAYDGNTNCAGYESAQDEARALLAKHEGGE